MKNKSLSSSGMLILAGVALIAVAVILVLVVGLQGETQYADVNPQNISTDSVTCKGTLTKYPLFEDLFLPSSESMDIKATFQDNQIQNLGLEYIATFSDASQARTAYNQMFVQLGESAGQAQDALNSHFTVRNDQVIMSLLTEGANFNTTTAKFYLMGEGKLPQSKSEIIKIYEGIGLKCQES